MRLFRKTIIADVDVFPAEYKTDGKVTINNIRSYEKDFKVNIIPIDTSPRNTGGTKVITFRKV